VFIFSKLSFGEITVYLTSKNNSVFTTTYRVAIPFFKFFFQFFKFFSSFSNFFPGFTNFFQVFPVSLVIFVQIPGFLA